MTLTRSVATKSMSRQASDHPLTRLIITLCATERPWYNLLLRNPLSSLRHDRSIQIIPPDSPISAQWSGFIAAEIPPLPGNMQQLWRPDVGAQRTWHTARHNIYQMSGHNSLLHLPLDLPTHHPIIAYFMSITMFLVQFTNVNKPDKIVFGRSRQNKIYF